MTLWSHTHGTGARLSFCNFVSTTSPPSPGSSTQGGLQPGTGPSWLSATETAETLLFKKPSPPQVTHKAAWHLKTELSAHRDAGGARRACRVTPGRVASVRGLGVRGSSENPPKWGLPEAQGQRSRGPGGHRGRAGSPRSPQVSRRGGAASVQETRKVSGHEVHMESGLTQEIRAFPANKHRRCHENDQGKLKN